MGFAIITQTMSPNAESTFDFSASCTGGATIQQIVYGISQFTLQVSSEYVSELTTELSHIGISLTSPTGGVGFTFITLLADITLSPASAENCSVSVTALAYIGSSSSVVLNNQTSITGVSNKSIGLDGTPNVCTGILSGFNFSSSDGSAVTGFGAFAGAVLAPGNLPTKPAALPMGNGICLVGNHKPMTTTVDVGYILFTADQSSEIVMGTISDCMNFTSNTSTTGHTVSSPSPLPPLSSVAIFLQSFALQFKIEFYTVGTPPFGSAMMGASDIALPATGGFTFTSSENMLSCIQTPSTDGIPEPPTYPSAPSITATYFYVGILAT